VFHQLHLGAQKTVHYFQKPSGAEIDFIVDSTVAYEVKTRANERDLLNIQKISRELGIKKCTVISRYVIDVPWVMYPFSL